MQLKIIKAFFKMCCLCAGLQVFVPCTAWAANDPCRDIGESGECELFKDSVQVQPRIAQQLIRLALNDENIVFGEYTNKTAGDDTYTVTDSRGAKHVFWFDDMQDSKSGNVNSSIAYAVCILNGGSMLYNGIGRCDGKLNESKLNQDLAQFAMRASCKCQNGCASGAIKEPHCEISSSYITSEPKGFVYNGHEIIDPKVFSNMQIVNNSDIEMFLEDYVILKLGLVGLVVDSFKCLSRPMYYSDGGMGADDLLRCTVKYKDGFSDDVKASTIDFIFDDMLEHNKTTAAAGRSGLVCHAQGGSVTTQGVCAGFTQEMCVVLSDTYGVNTQWDENAGGCLMLDSQKQAKIEKVQHYAGAGTLFVLGVVTLPVSGGASVVGVVAAIGGVLTLVADVGHSVSDHKIDAGFAAALIGANKCLIKDCETQLTINENMETVFIERCEKCATESIQNLIVAMLQYPSKMEDSDAEVAMYLLERLFPVIEGTTAPICIDAATQMVETSNWESIKTVSEVAMSVGVLMSLGTHAGNAGKIVTVADKIKSLRGAKNIATTTSVIGRSARLQRIAQRISSVSKKTLETIKHLKEVTAPFSGKAAQFADKIMTADDVSDGLESAGGLVAAWNSTCSTQFPCEETITHFMRNDVFNNMCETSGIRSGEPQYEISTQEDMI